MVGGIKMNNQQIDAQKIIEKLGKKIGDAHCQISINETQIDQLQEALAEKDKEIQELRDQLAKYAPGDVPEVIESSWNK